MDRCSYFIEDKAIFGTYPFQETVHELEKNGVRYFIDLTLEGESKITPYKTTYNILKFHISDRSIPRNWTDFSVFLVKVCRIIKNLQKDEKIYVHCRGGHGRAGVMVASIFCYLLCMKPAESLKRTSLCHSHRPVMRERWRIMGSPQTNSQKQFIHRFFHPVIMDDVHIKLGENDDENYDKVMNIVNSTPELKNKLLKTGLRPIAGCDPVLKFWLEKIRDELFFRT